MNPNTVIGKHLIADFYGASFQSDIKSIEQALRSAAEQAGATVLDVVLHEFPDNNGITGVAVLAESHISIHSWPEHDYIAFDVFMCGEADPQIALQWLIEFFKPAKVATQVINRMAPTQEATW